ncbi:tail fiber protein [Fluviispira multicolorata]|uniref:Phage tail collar domain-containing protein n=1 Tax=Fluviispira multicolorata TaxID=2654512 RepID=A0A833JEF0_9BACT|nr:tail fiber protein [Fluviispira multicolorata]KAB8031864.1 hypothetical protein GCL57_04260 [Fluviispira multicolorata]
MTKLFKFVPIFLIAQFNSQAFADKACSPTNLFECYQESTKKINQLKTKIEELQKGNMTGQVIAFAGTDIPAGWLLCDGREFQQSQYPELFKVIKNIYGGNEAYTFKLPDYRGLFLRGMNGDRSDNLADPDKDNRKGGNKIGSLQFDEFMSHNHDYMVRGINSIFSHAGGTGWDWDAKGTTTNTGGKETRPKNIYVNYLIKY